MAAGWRSRHLSGPRRGWAGRRRSVSARGGAGRPPRAGGGDRVPASRRTRRLRVEGLAAAQGMSAEESFRFLHGIRHHEPGAGLLLGRLAERVPGEAVRPRHAADEVRHAHWWGEIIARLGGSVTDSPLGPNWATVLGARPGSRTRPPRAGGRSASPTSPTAPPSPCPTPRSPWSWRRSTASSTRWNSSSSGWRTPSPPDATISRRLAQIRDDEGFHIAWVAQRLARRRAG